MGLLLLAACPDDQTKQVDPKLELGRKAIDFGSARPGVAVAARLEVRSVSTVPLTFDSVTLEDDAQGAFAVTATPSELAPEEAGAVDLTFRAPAVGDFRATLLLSTTDPSSPARVTLSGRGAVPSLRLVPECRTPCTGVTATGTPPALDFGARRPLTGTEPAWPTVTLLNEGELPVLLQSVQVQGAGFELVEAGDVAGVSIGPGAGQVLHLRFSPVSSQASYTGALVVQSDDPAHPRLEVGLSGTLAPGQPPVVCAAIVESIGPDGTVSRPPAFDGLQPPVQPGRTSQLTLSPFSDHFAPGLHPDEATRGDPARCTTSPETGRKGLAYLWSVEEQPAESSARFAKPEQAEPTFSPDAIGHYRLRLTVTDPAGLTGTAEVEFDAWPRRDLVAQLSWKEPGVDLDLHLVRPGANCGGSCVFDPTGDLNGFSSRKGPVFEWGAPGTQDDPRLDRDDQGTQGGVETLTLDSPEHDPACASGSCTYGLYVHYFADARPGSALAPACPGIGSAPCREGDACGCAAPSRCVSARCVVPPRLEVAIWIKPRQGSAPVRVPLPAEDFSIAGPCFLWHLADVVWKSDGTGALQEVGTPGTREFGYWGRLSPGSFSCAANTDPGLPAGYRPGTVPEYQ